MVAQPEPLFMAAESGTEPAALPAAAGLRIPTADEAAPVHAAPIAPADQNRPPAIWLLGAHGGAGVTTLEESWAPAGDCLGGWPSADADPYTVIVCRTHARGLEAAHILLRQARAGHIGRARLVGLVTVADAPGKLPAKLRHRLRVVQAAAPNTWSIPWIGDLRLTTADTPLPVWHPGDPIPQRRRRQDPLTELHPDIAATGDSIFVAVREMHTEKRA